MADVSDDNGSLIAIIATILVILIAEGFVAIAINGGAITTIFGSYTPPEPPTVTGNWWDTINNVGYYLQYIFSSLSYGVTSLGQAIVLISGTLYSFLPAAIINSILMVILAIAFIRLIMP